MLAAASALAGQDAAQLNAILAPDGCELRTSGFISGRPVYAASRTVSGPGRMIRLEVEDDDVGKLDIRLSRGAND